jgi:hypothetical protein
MVLMKSQSIIAMWVELTRDVSKVSYVNQQLGLLWMFAKCLAAEIFVNMDVVIQDMVEDLIAKKLDLLNGNKNFKDGINPEVYKLELIVMQHYSINDVELKDWRYDSEAKIMICYLLQHLHGYSIGALAVRYRVKVLRLKHLLNMFNENLNTSSELRNRLANIFEKLLSFSC